MSNIQKFCKATRNSPLAFSNYKGYISALNNIQKTHGIGKTKEIAYIYVEWLSVFIEHSVILSETEKHTLASNMTKLSKTRIHGN